MRKSIAAVGWRTEGSSLVGLVRLGRLVVVVGALGHHLYDGFKKRLERPCGLAWRGQRGGADQLMANEAIKAVADDDALVAGPPHLAGEAVELRVHPFFPLRC